MNLTMSKELKWCLNFARAVQLRGHKKKRIRKKNIKRVERMRSQAFKKWGYFPLPIEWIPAEWKKERKE